LKEWQRLVFETRRNARTTGGKEVKPEEKEDPVQVVAAAEVRRVNQLMCDQVAALETVTVDSDT